MKNSFQTLMLSLFLFTISLMTSCTKDTSDYTKIEPAKIEHIDNSDVEKLTLTEKAVERIDIKTTEVKEMLIAPGDQVLHKVVPYAAVLYDVKGQTWVYTNPNPLVFIRDEIKVDRIEGDRAILTDGPAVGTKIVIQGASELLGTEYHVGH